MLSLQEVATATIEKKQDKYRNLFTDLELGAMKPNYGTLTERGSWGCPRWYIRCSKKKTAIECKRVLLKNGLITYSCRVINFFFSQKKLSEEILLKSSKDVRKLLKLFHEEFPKETEEYISSFLKQLGFRKVREDCISKKELWKQHIRPLKLKLLAEYYKPQERVKHKVVVKSSTGCIFEAAATEAQLRKLAMCLTCFVEEEAKRIVR